MQIAFAGSENRDWPQFKLLENDQAARFKKTLVDASARHQSHEAAHQRRRAGILGNLQDNLLAESTHEDKVRWCYDNFARKIEESFEMVGEEKEAAQRRAGEYIRTANEESQKARKRRQMVDSCRKEIAILDNVRAVAAETYAVAIQTVVIEAFDCVKATETKVAAEDMEHRQAKSVDPPETGIGAKKGAEAPTASSKDKASTSKDTLPKSAQQVIQQSVFECHPEIEHQSVDEVHYNLKSTEENVGLKQTADKSTPQDREVPKPSKASGPHSHVLKQSKKKGKTTDLEPRSKPNQAASKAQGSAVLFGHPALKLDEKYTSGSSQNVSRQAGAKQSQKKTKATNPEPEPEPIDLASKAQRPLSEFRQCTPKPEGQFGPASWANVVQQSQGKHWNKKLTAGQEQMVKLQQAQAVIQEAAVKVAMPVPELPELKFALQQKLSAKIEKIVFEVEEPALKTQDKPAFKIEEQAPKFEEKAVSKTEEPVFKAQETPAVASAKIDQHLQASVMTICTKDGNNKQLAVSVNGHTITSPIQVVALLRDEQARKDSFGLNAAQDGAKENETNGKDPMKEDDNGKTETISKVRVHDPNAAALARALAEANSPVAVQPTKSKSKNKSKSKKKKKKKTGGNASSGGERQPDGDSKPDSASDTTAVGDRVDGN